MVYEILEQVSNSINLADVVQPPPEEGRFNIPDTVNRFIDLLRKHGDTLTDLELDILSRLNDARAEFGYGKYHTYLKSHNGRDARADGVQELGDYIEYTTQLAIENRLEYSDLVLLNIICRYVNSLYYAPTLVRNACIDIGEQDESDT